MSQLTLLWNTLTTRIGGAGCSVREGRRAEELPGFARGEEASGSRVGRAATHPPTPDEGKIRYFYVEVQIQQYEVAATKGDFDKPQRRLDYDNS